MFLPVKWGCQQPLLLGVVRGPGKPEGSRAARALPAGGWRLGASPPRPYPARPRPRPASSSRAAAPCLRAMSAGWFRRRFLPGGPLPAPRPPRPRSSPVPYRRPRFLRGSGSGPCTADAPRRPDVRPVRSPARGRALPWNAGYAE